MNRVTFPLAGQVLLIAMALVSPLCADGFDPIGARALFRDLGVSLGPGYHHPPCLPHLRQHYDMAVSGQPLPASRVTPLHFLNSNCMQASRYVPVKGPSSIMMPSAIPQDFSAQPVPYALWNETKNVLVPQSAAPGAAAVGNGLSRDVHCTDGLKLDRERTTDLPKEDPSNGDNRVHNDSLLRRPGATRRPSSLESPFEPYSPNAPPEQEGASNRNGDLPMPDREAGSTSPQDSASTSGQGTRTLLSESSPSPAPAPEPSYYDGNRFDDVEIENDLVPIQDP